MSKAKELVEKCKVGEGASLSEWKNVSRNLSGITSEVKRLDREMLPLDTKNTKELVMVKASLEKADKALASYVTKLKIK